MDKSLRKHFANLKDIIRYGIRSKESSEYLNDLNCLKKRAKSKVLNVAVIGEFNSGKSTFINALLRDRVLKEGGLPTTAAATHISRSRSRTILEFLFGTRSYIYVKFDDGKSYNFTRKDDYICSYYINKRFNKQVNGFNDIFHRLTAEQDIAKHVVELSLEYKTRSLPKNIVLIDTPGFNPGVEDFDNHLTITENVVAKEADMAIILIPATQPMSATLMDFLESNIVRYIHRCVFVITKIDAVSAEERIVITDYVKGQLEQLGLSSPKIYCVSARTMLPVKKVPDSMRRIWTVFQNKFMKMETELWSALSIYKQITIHERVCHLLDDLSSQINSIIQTHKNQLQKTLEILKSNNIQLIETVTAKLYNDACLAIDRFYSGINLSSSAYRSSAKDTARSIIRNGGRLRHYKDREAPRINQSIKSNGEQYLSSVKIAVNNSTAIIQNQLTIFKTTFHSHYKDMPSLEPTMNYAPKLSSFASTTVDLTTSESLNNGSFLGRVLTNLGNLFRSETDIQNDVISEVNNSIDSHFIHLEGSVRKCLEESKNNQKRLLKLYCDEHVTKYSRQVKTLIKEQKTKENSLQTSISSCRVWLGALERTRKAINNDAERLSRIK